MSLITVVITLIVVGVLLWLEEKYIPLAAPMKNIIRIVVVLCVVLWLLGPVFGLLHYADSVKVPSAR